MTDYRSPGAGPEDLFARDRQANSPARAFLGEIDRPPRHLPARPRIQRHKIVFTGNAVTFFVLVMSLAVVVIGLLALLYAAGALTAVASANLGSPLLAVLVLVAVAGGTAFVITLLYYVPQRYFFDNLEIEMVEPPPERNQTR